MDTHIKKIEQGRFVYSINSVDNSVSIIDSISTVGKIFIPSFIIYESKEYKVTSISKSAFNGSNQISSIHFESDSQLLTIEQNAFCFSSIQKISIPSHLTKIGEGAFCWCEQLHEFEIPENSELQIIEKDAFCLTSIESIKIPSKLIDLKNEWCSCMQLLTKINVSPNNPRYKLYENKFIIGKSSINENENFDVLVFCVRNIKTAKIPCFIKVIGQYAFERCSKLQKVEISNDSKLRLLDKYCFSHSTIESISIPSQLKTIGKSAFNYCERFKRIEIPNNSELQTIEKNAFCDSLIESIFIPSSIVELKEGWCCCTPKLTEFRVDKNNLFYKEYEGKFIIGKSSFEKEIFDVLMFCIRNIKIALIPSFIEIIGALSFNECEKLQTIEFSNDSNLQLIKKNAFSCSSIQRISIPKNVNHICEGAFSYCKKLQKVEIPDNSNLSIIEKEAFYNTSIVSFVISVGITEIGENAFCSCNKLQIIAINENLNLKFINKKVSNACDDIILMIPTKK